MPAEESGGTSTPVAQVRFCGRGALDRSTSGSRHCPQCPAHAGPSGREVVPRLALWSLGQPSAAFDPS